LDGIYLLKQIDEWLFVKVALLLIGLAHISFDKTSFDPLGGDQSSFRLPAQFPFTGDYIVTFFASKVK
jgi:hypothetical protein